MRADEVRARSPPWRYTRLAFGDVRATGRCRRRNRSPLDGVWQGVAAAATVECGVRGGAGTTPMASPRASTPLIVLSYLGFVSLGLPDGLLGVATPSIRASFALGPEAIGGLLLSFTAGYLLSSFVSGAVVVRLGIGTLLAASCLATAASLFGYASAGAWWTMLVSAVLSGLGAGAIDAGLNTWVATHHGPRTVNWLHACYGVGATAGPLLMTAVLAAGQPWRAGYAAVGVAQLALALCFAVTRRLWSDPLPGGVSPHAASAALRASASAASHEPATHAHGGSYPHAPEPLGATLRLPATWIGGACFFVYAGIEATTGVWTFSMLTQARGVPVADAGGWVTAFWAGLMLGRFAFGFVAERAPVAVLLRGALAAIALGATVLALDLGAVATASAMVVCGLAMAPVFPSMIATTPARVGVRHTGNAVGFQVAAATLGASLVPAATGFVVARLGLEAVAPAILAASLLLVGLHELLVRATGAAARRTAQPIG